LKVGREKQGIDKYIVDNDNDESNSDDDLFEKDELSGSMMNKEVDDPRDLIDLELIKLLSYCQKL
jgi:hypothetical protein